MRSFHLHDQIEWEPLVGIIGLAFVAAVIVALVIWALASRSGRAG